VAQQTFRIATFLVAPLFLLGTGCASRSTTSSAVEPHGSHGDSHWDSNYHSSNSSSGRVLGITHERGQQDPDDCSPLEYTSGVLSSNPPPAPSINDPEDSLIESVRRYAAEMPSRVSTFPCGTAIFLPNAPRNCLQPSESGKRFESDGRLAAEFALGSRFEQTNVRLRAMFFNTRGVLVGVSPVMSMSAPQGRPQQITVRSKEPGATRYVLLVAGE